MASFSLLIDAQCIFERVEFDIRKVISRERGFLVVKIVERWCSNLLSVAKLPKLPVSDEY